MITPVSQIVYNIAQLMFILSKAKVWVLEWGRGTGKSTIIGRHLYDCVVEMPRSTGAIVGATYAQIKTRTLPSTIAGLEQHGIIKDLHYVIGRRPPKEWNWPEAYQAMLDPTNCIFWWNGTVTVFISLDGNATSGRGQNIDWAVGDEAALFDEEKFMTDVELTIRGNLTNKAIYPDGSWKYFEQCDRHHSLLLATSTPLTVAGQWVLKYEEEARKNPERVKFISASAAVNFEALGDDYFKRSKAIMPDFLYDAEVLNKRVTKIRDGFYPKFNERQHTYDAYNNEYYKSLQFGDAVTCSGDEDHDTAQPLIVAIDWGARINCMVVAQSTREELRFLKNFYVLAPQIIDDLVDDFLAYYGSRSNRTIYFWYDASGNVRQANSRKTFAEQVIEILRTRGWNVHPMTNSRVNDSHELKFKLWTLIMMENNPKFPRVRFNRPNCKELIVSITTAPAKKGQRVAIQKDKKSESSKSKVPQQHATHFSDTADLIVVGMYQQLLRRQEYVVESQLL